MKNERLPKQLQSMHGAIRVRGTRVPLDVIVQAFDAGATPEEVCLQYPTVTLENAYSAIAYYLNNRDAVEKYLKRRGARYEKMRRDSESRPGAAQIRQRLRERIKTAEALRA